LNFHGQGFAIYAEHFIMLQHDLLEFKVFDIFVLFCNKILGLMFHNETLLEILR